ncbi:type I phosphodiesterase/nucleotide pyrophosphatase/phosphate transferase family protein [Pseudohyphozyma bogoriensis]|nr:type I phosphodiesterase/nucleotide pyrophosphatase/phosphate transferase family protein [Pseudohyphozyma bogoriensis]
MGLLPFPSSTLQNRAPLHSSASNTLPAGPSASTKRKEYEDDSSEDESSEDETPLMEQRRKSLNAQASASPAGSAPPESAPNNLSQPAITRRPSTSAAGTSAGGRADASNVGGQARPPKKKMSTEETRKTIFMPGKASTKRASSTAASASSRPLPTLQPSTSSTTSHSRPTLSHRSASYDPSNHSSSHGNSNAHASTFSSHTLRLAVLSLQPTDVPLPLNASLFSLGFQLPAPASVKDKGKSTQAAGGKEAVVERSNDDATTLLQFLFARGGMGSWTKLVATKDATRLAVFSLEEVDPESKAVIRREEVVAALKSPGMEFWSEKELEKERKEAENCAVLTILRTVLVQEEARTMRGKALRAVIYGEDDEGSVEAAQEVFVSYRTVHPKWALKKLKIDFQGIGTLLFAEKCKELVDLFEGAIEQLDDEGNEIIGFGEWQGEWVQLLKACLTSIHKFILTDWAYIPDAINTLNQLMAIALRTSTDDEAEGIKLINSRLAELEAKDAEVEEHYQALGQPRPVPKVYSMTMPKKRRVESAVANDEGQAASKKSRTESGAGAPERRHEPQETAMDVEPSTSITERVVLSPQPISTAPLMSTPSPGAPLSPLPEISSRPPQPQPTAQTTMDPRTRPNNLGGSPTPTPAAVRSSPRPSPRHSPVVQTQPEQRDQSRQRVSASPLPFAFPARGTRSPSVAPAPAHPAPQARRGSRLPSRSVSQAAAPQPSGSPAPARKSLPPRTAEREAYLSNLKNGGTTPLVASVAALNLPSDTVNPNQNPTPRPTPECDPGKIQPYDKGEMDELVMERPLLDPTKAMVEEKPVLRWSDLVVGEDELERLRLPSREDDVDVPLTELPLRARVRFQRSEQGDAAYWPNTNLKINNSFIPVFATGKTILHSSEIDVSHCFRSGANNAQLSRRRGDRLPADLTITIELCTLFRLHQEDERTWYLYDELARRITKPVDIPLLDPSSRQRIVLPVRGPQCNHLQTFDFETHVTNNWSVEEGSGDLWACPIPECGEEATPAKVAICTWTLQTLTEQPEWENVEVAPTSDEGEGEAAMEIPAMAPKYSSVPSGSTADLSRPADDDQDSDALDRQERAVSSDNNARHGRDKDEDTTEHEETEAEEGMGMLSGVNKEEDVLEELEDELGTGTRIEGRKDYRAWYGQIRVRTILLSLLAILSLLTLLFFFHPPASLSHLSEQVSTSLTGYYSGHLYNSSVGLFSPTGVVADNPLPSDAKFGDVPFASLGRPQSTDIPTPAWAGGNGEIDPAGRPGKYWNGTHWYDKTVILMSLDGFRADYLEKGFSPFTFNVSRRGLKADYLKPVFPSLTFPNHYSILTGLYPASHGIVANDFYDPAIDQEFIYTNPTHSWQPQWWGGEPIWSTAVKNGFKTGVLMWPGPPKMADGAKPTYWVPFETQFFLRKLDKIAEWLDMPSQKRPQLMTVYAPEIDQIGHRHGTHSHDIERTLNEMDHFVSGVWDILEARNLTGIVDVIVISDHGMTDTHNERIVFLDDILGEEGFKGIARSEGLRFHDHINTTEMQEKLIAAANGSKGGFHVYTPETMPEKWHFAGHERIAPLYVVPHVGWAVSNHEEFDVKMKGTFKPKGNHGYDNDDPSMHAIFVAHGPFAERIKTVDKRKRAAQEESAVTTTETSTSSTTPEHITTIPGFANLEIYNLVAELLGIPEGMRAPNNGTRGFWQQYLD